MLFQYKTNNLGHTSANNTTLQGYYETRRGNREGPLFSSGRLLADDDDKSIKWLEAIGLPHYVDYYKKERKGWYRVCSDHFDESCYLLKRRLLKTAVPTIQKLPTKDFSTHGNTHNNHSNSTAKPEYAFPVSSPCIEDKVTKADDTVVDEHTLRIEINRRAELEEAKSALRKSKLERYLKSSRKLLGPKTSQLITCQVLMKEGDKRKFSVKHKLFCLDLYYHNPRAYRFLQQFICLPPVATLRSLYLNVNSGFISPRCLQILKNMVAQMNTKDRCCIVGIASTKIKKHVYYDVTNDTVHGIYKTKRKQWKVPVKKAYTLVVKGLLSTWQMPIAFALFHDSDVIELQQWSDSIIRILIFNGLDVRAFVSDQGNTDNKLLSELRKISSVNNSFTVTGKVIYNIFDVKLLVKSLRDSLMSFDISIDFEGVASWKHILAFYNTDIELQTYLAPGLTNTHVNPDENQRSSTKHAVELFSETVATAMKAFLRLKLLDEDAVATVNLINRISDLVTLFNLDTLKHDSRNNRQFKGEERRELLKKLLEYFAGVKRSSNGFLFEPIVGLMVTIKSTLDLWKDFSDDDEFHLKTQSLNLQAIDSGFGEINALNTKRKNKCNQVTTIEFIRAFNKSFLNHVIKNAQHKTLKNFKSSLSKLQEYLVSKTKENDLLLDLEAKPNAILIGDLENKIILPNINVLRYLAGYLIKRALEKHGNCVQLKNYLTPSNTKANTFIDCHYLEVKVPVEFVIFLVKLEHEFVKVFREVLLPREIGARALNAMKHLVILPCRCFPLFLIKKLFIRIRIYNAVKDINRQLKTTDAFQINTIEI
ncbi:hypothetical protein MSG28_012931 [Choristoneura fumiferana]|uniref:Uncharacterized protein n=1 Tax=Choristoneura fumiferana TaxID=7141 RepID=A0ACC0KSL2_CHOFU|nr:hypothetical protein MSG28_012931 [Choristoneura fumiferana]